MRSDPTAQVRTGRLRTPVLKCERWAVDPGRVTRAHLSLASVSRGGFLACVGAWTVLLHAVHLALAATASPPVHDSLKLVGLLVWAGIALWGLRRGRRVSETELGVATSCGALVITVDGIWGGVPDNPVLVSAGLLALLLGLGAFGGGWSVPVAGLFLTCCQAALVTATTAHDPVGVFTAVSTTVTTGGSCLLVWWLQRELRALLQTSRSTADHDPLTGLLNRRGMTQHVARLRAREAHADVPGVAVLDLDHFKTVNDLHGHDVGDQVLVQVATALRSCVREGDLLVRLGGEEIAWIGLWAHQDDAVAGAERVRREITASCAHLGLAVTASIGLALAPGPVEGPLGPEVLSALVARADGALYAAKRAGRDRVVLAPADPVGADVPGHDGAPAPLVRDGGSGRAGGEGQRA